MAENFFSEIDIYEQQATFGGVWNYTAEVSNANIMIPQVDLHQPYEEPLWRYGSGKRRQSRKQATFISPMYERLETNIPHTLMAYSDDPSITNNQLFPRREAVLRYLEAYGEDVRHLIHFETQVTSIHRSADGKDAWHLTVRDLASNRISSKKYDAVVVASGHYSVPHIPNIKGIKHWNDAYPGRISHSKFYRRPDDFAGKKTVVIGNSASGLDISSQISPVCASPLLVAQRSVSPLAMPSQAQDTEVKRVLPEIVEFLQPSLSTGQRAVRFANGHVEEDVDSILFCTGYYHSYPFLSNLQPPLITSGDRVHHLYQHVFYIPDPTLAFVGIPAKILPFRTYEGQAAVIARIWSGRLQLASKDRMDEWEKKRITQKGNGRRFHELLTPEDMDYHNAMVDWAEKAKPATCGKMPRRWSEEDYWARERLPALKGAFAKQGEGRKLIRSMGELGFDYVDRKQKPNE